MPALCDCLDWFRLAPSAEANACCAAVHRVMRWLLGLGVNRESGNHLVPMHESCVVRRQRMQATKHPTVSLIRIQLVRPLVGYLLHRL